MCKYECMYVCMYVSIRMYVCKYMYDVATTMLSPAEEYANACACAFSKERGVTDVHVHSARR